MTALYRRRAQRTKKGRWGAAFVLASKFVPRASLATNVKTARCLIIFSDADLHGFEAITTYIIYFKSHGEAPPIPEAAARIFIILFQTQIHADLRRFELGRGSELWIGAQAVCL